MTSSPLTTIDLPALDALLSQTNWPRSKLELILGIPLTGGVTIETKRLIWALISDEKARQAVDLVRLSFPEATVEAIR